MTSILAALIGATGTVLAVIIPLMWRAHGRRLDVITEQVTNSHSTNLRDDLDEAIGLMRLVANTQVDHGRQLNAHGEAIINLRTDLTWERRERMDLARAMTGKEPLA